MGGSGRNINLWFASISFVALGVVAVLAALLGTQLVSSSEHESAERSANVLVAAPLRTILDSTATDATTTTLSDEAKLRLQALAPPLITSDLKALRVWSLDGASLFSTGEAGPAEVADDN